MLTLKKKKGELPGGSVVATLLPLPGVWVYSFVRELESCMLSGTAKKKFNLIN